jgi:hypothetical protein
MRTLAIALVLLCSCMAVAQSKPTHADMANQSICYAQALVVVPKTDKYPAKLDGAHYDAVSKTCYVQWSRMAWTSAQWDGIDQIEVEDAFEHKYVAEFIGVAGEGITPPTSCQVNGEKCDSRAQFNGLLWKFIPAFKPVTAN